VVGLLPSLAGLRFYIDCRFVQKLKRMRVSQMRPNFGPTGVPQRQGAPTGALTACTARPESSTTQRFGFVQMQR